MKVILQQDVKGHGKKGEMVNVSDGYARNYLLPRKLAVEASTGNINTMQLQEKAKKAQMEKERQEALETEEKLQSCIVKISAKAGSGGRLFGAVTSKEISEALLGQHGITIEKNKIIQEEHIKGFGSYEIKCRLGHEVTGRINVLVVEG